MKKILLCLSLAAAFSVSAQQSIGPDSSGTQQNIGDIDNSAASSSASQVNPSAVSNGNDLSTATDVRAQISPTINPNTTSNALGANLALGNNSSASNGPQSMGQANTGNSSVGNTTTGPSTATAAGGAGGAGGQGGSSNGTNAQGQLQTAAGGAGGSSTGTNTSRNSQATSAGNGAGAGAGSGNRTDNTTRVDASDRSSTSYEAKTTVWAPVIHGQAAPALAAANLVVLPGVCGPRVWVERVPVVGKRFGVWGGQSDVEQGYDEAIRPEAEPFVQRGAYLIGHQVTQFTAVIGTSSAGSFSLGGYGKNGDGAQGGGAASGQLQQIVSKVQVRECVMAQPKIEIAIPFIERAAPAPRADRN